MPNRNSLEKTYLYDGTWDGFLSLFFYLYANKEKPKAIMPKEKYESNFLDIVQSHETNERQAERVFHGIERNISYNALYNSYYAFLAEEAEKEMDLVKYLSFGFQKGPQIDTMLSIPYVFHVHQMRKKSLSECHKLKGLVRFKELDSSLYYSSIHPTHNILEPLGHHFIRRLPTQNFIIHDKVRNKAFLYNALEYRIVENITFPEMTLSEAELQYEALWKTFFQTIAIKERTNPRLQMQYMPKKYWQDLIEKS